MHPDWPVDLQEQCDAFDIPFLFKQWGAWGPDQFDLDEEPLSLWVSPDGTTIDGGIDEVQTSDCAKPVKLMVRYGKKKNGRIIDGKTYTAFPSGM